VARAAVPYIERRVHAGRAAIDRACRAGIRTRAGRADFAGSAGVAACAAMLRIAGDVDARPCAVDERSATSRPT
jgi:hypothetical protein